jgi:hypothetical protein
MCSTMHRGPADSGNKFSEIHWPAVRNTTLTGLNTSCGLSFGAAERALFGEFTLCRLNTDVKFPSVPCEIQTPGQGSIYAIAWLRQSTSEAVVLVILEMEIG